LICNIYFDFFTVYFYQIFDSFQALNRYLEKSKENAFILLYIRSKMNTFTKDFSDEEITKDWTLSDFNLEQITEFRKSYQLYATVQICSIVCRVAF